MYSTISTPSKLDFTFNTEGTLYRVADFLVWFLRGSLKGPSGQIRFESNTIK
jgi:hypothetical protein